MKSLSSSRAFIRTTLSLRHPSTISARLLFDLTIEHGYSSSFVLSAIANMVDEGEVVWTPARGYELTQKSLDAIDREVADSIK